MATACWNLQIQNIMDVDKTNVQLETELEEFIHSYTSHTAPCNVITKYVQKDHNCKKRKEMHNQTHCTRIQNLIVIANCLRGTMSCQIDVNIKRMIFEIFSEVWCDKYHAANKNMETDDLMDILRYMNKCKTQAEKEAACEEHKCKQNEKQNGNNNNNNNKRQ